MKKIPTVLVHDPDDWRRHVLMEVTLRKALNMHIDSHCSGEWIRCEAAMALFALLPDGAHVMFA